MLNKDIIVYRIKFMTLKVEGHESYTNVKLQAMCCFLHMKFESYEVFLHSFDLKRPRRSKMNEGQRFFWQGMKKMSLTNFVNINLS